MIHVFEKLAKYFLGLKWTDKEESILLLESLERKVVLQEIKKCRVGTHLRVNMLSKQLIASAESSNDNGCEKKVALLAHSSTTDFR